MWITLWTVTESQWAGENQPLSFDGHEVEGKNGGYFIHQPSFTPKLLGKYPEIDGNSYVFALKEYRCGERPGNTVELVSQAQTIAGQLLWLAGRTRLEIGYSVSKMSQMISVDPNEAITRKKQVLRLLHHAPDTGLWYGPAHDDYGTFRQLHCRRHQGLVEGYSDASFAGDEGFRSFSANQLFGAGGLVFWTCGRQTLLAASTAEAELVAMGEAHAMTTAMLPTIEALSEDSSSVIEPILYMDNSAALQLCTLDAGSWRTRHLRLRSGLIRQSVEP